jgi:hypothetical protein
MTTPRFALPGADSAEVEVSSTEFGISGLIVGRNRDYRKDVAVVPFYQSWRWFTVGPRWHGGRRSTRRATSTTPTCSMRSRN